MVYDKLDVMMDDCLSLMSAMVREVNVCGFGSALREYDALSKSAKLNCFDTRRADNLRNELATRFAQLCL